MIMRQTAPNRRQVRRGGVVVETAVALPILLFMMFALLDYGKMVMTVQLLNNAAREGARLAVVNTNSMTTSQIVSQVQYYLAGQNLSGMSVTVYQVDPASGNNLGSWNSTTLGGSIAVQITGNYQPLLPTFSQLPTTIPVTATAMMTCEAN
jgi:Flp pilus assembly protein TadG